MPHLRSIAERKECYRSIVCALDNSAIAQKYPSFQPVLEALHHRLNKISGLPLLREKSTDSKSKKKFKYKLALAAHHASCGVYAYAQISGNLALKNAVQYSVSDFYRPEEATVISRVRQIINAIKKVKNPVHFGLTDEIIEKLHHHFKQFMDYKNKPQIQIKKHAQALRHADKLLDECLQIIQQQLDPLVTVVSQTEKQLKHIYSANRKIKKSPGRKRKYVKKQKSVTESKVLPANLLQTEVAPAIPVLTEV